MKKINTLLFLLILISSCQQLDPNKQIDEGKVEKNSYSSKEIGWTINIPKGWKVTSKEQHERHQERGKVAIEEMTDTEYDDSGLKNLIGFQKNQYTMFNSTSESFKLEYEGEWEESNAAIKELIYNTYISKGIKADSTATKIVKIDGLDFHSSKFVLYHPKSDEVLLNQIIFSRYINGFDFNVNINYNNEADFKVMLDAWKNSKFKK